METTISYTLKYIFTFKVDENFLVQKIYFTRYIVYNTLLLLSCTLLGWKGVAFIGRDYKTTWTVILKYVRNKTCFGVVKYIEDMVHELQQSYWVVYTLFKYSYIGNIQTL